MAKKKPEEEHLKLVAGKVEPAIKSQLTEILRRRGIGESEYVRRAVTAQVKRDLKTLATV